MPAVDAQEAQLATERARTLGIMDQLKEENLEVGGDRRRLRAERDEARGEAEVRKRWGDLAALFWPFLRANFARKFSEKVYPRFLSARSVRAARERGGGGGGNHPHQQFRDVSSFEIIYPVD